MTIQVRKLTGKADENVKAEQLSATTEFMTAAGGKVDTLKYGILKGTKVLK